MMHVIRSAARGAATLVVAAALAACDNEVPTATGSDLFPGGVAPTTLVTEFTGSDLILRQETHEGFGDPRLAPFLLVANAFDGELYAHPLVRFTNIPDSVSYTDGGASRRDEVGSYVGGRVQVHVDSLATLPEATTRLLLWELAQPWDSATVTWEYAVDRPGEQVPWTTPGGTLGNLIDEVLWQPGDTAQKDTVVWQLDSLTVHRMRSEDHPGLVVTTDRVGARVKLSGLTFVGDARPAANPDTVVETRTMQGVQTFIFTPDIPQDPDVLSTGGLRGNRTIFTLDLEQEVEACPASGGGCTMVSVRDVTVNRAQLVLEPLAVPGGHRPIVTPTVQLRSIAEPELGRFAPLGSLLANDTISPSAFAAGTDREFTLDLTNAILRFLAAQDRAERDGEEIETEMSFALLTSFEVPDLGLLWFQRTPRLRVVYTLPLNPALP